MYAGVQGCEYVSIACFTSRKDILLRPDRPKDGIKFATRVRLSVAELKIETFKIIVLLDISL